jgi:hypothetical protein
MQNAKSEDIRHMCYPPTCKCSKATKAVFWTSISLTWSLIYNHTYHTDTCSYNTVILSSCFVSVLTCTAFHLSWNAQIFTSVLTWIDFSGTATTEKIIWKSHAWMVGQQNGCQRNGVTCLLWLYSNSSLLLWQMSHLKSPAGELQVWNNYMNSIKKTDSDLHEKLYVWFQTWSTFNFHKM